MKKEMNNAIISLCGVNTMKKKLFGKNIIPNCAYCENSTAENEIVYCKKGKRIQNNKCRAFRYDPLLRSPKSSAFKNQYTADDFKI